jgi:hypothetical protein
VQEVGVYAVRVPVEELDGGGEEEHDAAGEGPIAVERCWLAIYQGL